MEGSGHEVPLVGRERELAVLRAAWTRAVAGTPGAVLVAGESGIGKSRLVRALVDDLAGPRERQPVLLRAHGVDLGEHGLPYLAVVDLARALRAVAAGDPAVAAALARWPLVDDLVAPGSRDGAPAEESHRLRLFDATAGLLAEVARERAVLLLVEDLQWVDASSADFLRFLLSRTTSERLLVVATVRTDGVAARPRVRRLLGDLARLPSVERLDLGPLDEVAVGDYLGCLGVTDARLGSEVFRRTGGHPYYLEVLAPGVAGTGTVGDALPPVLADVLVGRLEAAPPDARVVVQCVAVGVPPVPDRLLRRVAGLADDRADHALRAAVAEGLLRPEGEGYALTHDLLRAAVHDDLLPGERARLHAAYVGAMEEGVAGAPRAAEVAHHADRAGDRPRTLTWSLRAAAEAERVLAPDEALQHLERVLELDPQGDVAVRACRAAGLAGERGRALEWGRRAVALCDAAGEVTGGVRARAEWVRQLLATDRTAEAVAPAREAVALADGGEVDAGTSALARVVLARALLADRRPEECRPHADRALQQARGTGDHGLEVEALATVAFLDEIAGDRAAAADRLGAAIRLARAEEELAAELRAHYSLASMHYYNGDVAGSLPVLGAALARVAESGLLWSEPGVELRLLHAVALYAAGDLDGSLAAVEPLGGRPPDVAAARLAAVGCYAAVARGLPDAAARTAALAGSWDGDPQVALVAGGCEADRLTWAGEPAAAVAVAAAAQAHLDAFAGEGMYGGLWLSALALSALADEALVCRQRRDRSGASAAVDRGDLLLERVERITAGGHGRPGDLGPEGRAWRLRALAEHARLRGEPGVEEWQEALAGFGYGHAYEQARCHARLAEALLAAGDRAAARDHAETAATAAEQMGARPLGRAVEALTSRSRLTGGSGDAVLTGREREVLALVAEGMTNREVGRRLFISEKTASVHLSNLMAKLGVASRTEAVTVAHRRGLLDVL